jgi:hypothetical protein
MPLNGGLERQSTDKYIFVGGAISYKIKGSALTLLLNSERRVK